MTCNLFELPNMINIEVLHSSFIAWLLNPKEKHGLKDEFLKAFLKFISEKSALAEEYKQYISEIDNDNCNDVDVFNEFPYSIEQDKGCIDIFIKKTCEFVVVIENKITAKENHNQLDRYKKFVTTVYKESKYKHIFILLAPKSCSNLPEDYIKITYKDIYNILNNLKDIPNKSKEIISNYLQTISSFVDNKPDKAIVKQLNNLKTFIINKKKMNSIKSNYDLFSFKIDDKNLTTYWTISYENNKYYLNFCIKPKDEKQGIANYNLIEDFETNFNEEMKNFTKHYNKIGYYWVSDELKELEDLKDDSIQDKLSKSVLLQEKIINFPNKVNK